MPKGRPPTKTPALAWQILTLYLPGSLVTVKDIASATGEDRKTIGNALRYLAAQERVETDGVKVEGRNYARLWRIK